jgi:hypothetical protein
VREPSDAEIWRSVEATVRDVLLPAIDDEWARIIAVQLVGMVRLARDRPTDPGPARVAELAAILDELRDNPVVAEHWPIQSGGAAEVLAAVGAALASAVARTDAAGDEIRARLRHVVRRHLDEDLAVTSGLMPYFRGQLPDA